MDQSPQCLPIPRENVSSGRFDLIPNEDNFGGLETWDVDSELSFISDTVRSHKYCNDKIIDFDSSPEQQDICNKDIKDKDNESSIIFTRPNYNCVEWKSVGKNAPDTKNYISKIHSFKKNNFISKFSDVSLFGSFKRCDLDNPDISPNLPVKSYSNWEAKMKRFINPVKNQKEKINYTANPAKSLDSSSSNEWNHSLNINEPIKSLSKRGPLISDSHETDSLFPKADETSENEDETLKIVELNKKLETAEKQALSYRCDFDELRKAFAQDMEFQKKKNKQLLNEVYSLIRERDKQINQIENEINYLRECNGNLRIDNESLLGLNQQITKEKNKAMESLKVIEATGQKELYAVKAVISKMTQTEPIGTDCYSDWSVDFSLSNEIKDYKGLISQLEKENSELHWDYVSQIRENETLKEINSKLSSYLKGFLYEYKTIFDGEKNINFNHCQHIRLEKSTKQLNTGIRKIPTENIETTDKDKLSFNQNLSENGFRKSKIDGSLEWKVETHPGLHSLIINPFEIDKNNKFAKQKFYSDEKAVVFQDLEIPFSSPQEKNIASVPVWDVDTDIKPGDLILSPTSFPNEDSSIDSNKKNSHMLNVLRSFEKLDPDEKYTTNNLKLELGNDYSAEVKKTNCDLKSTTSEQDCSFFQELSCANNQTPKKNKLSALEDYRGLPDNQKSEAKISYVTNSLVLAPNILKNDFHKNSEITEKELVDEICLHQGANKLNDCFTKQNTFNDFHYIKDNPRLNVPQINNKITSFDHKLKGSSNDSLIIEDKTSKPSFKLKSRKNNQLRNPKLILDKYFGNHQRYFRKLKLTLSNLKSDSDSLQQKLCSTNITKNVIKNPHNTDEYTTSNLPRNPGEYGYIDPVLALGLHQNDISKLSNTKQKPLDNITESELFAESGKNKILHKIESIVDLLKEVNSVNFKAINSNFNESSSYEINRGYIHKFKSII